MPPKLRPITPEATAERIELRPETITLAAAKTIFTQLGDRAGADLFTGLRVHAYDMAKVVQELIDTPAPAGLVASARLIAEADIALLDAAGLRAAVADAYDRFHSATAQATEGFEILTAWTVMLESADTALRTGNLAA